MTASLVSAPLELREKHLEQVLSSPRFLSMQGLGNEVPFFICPFDPAESVAMDGVRHRVVNRLRQNGIEVLTIDLYDLAVSLLKERGVWQRILAAEPGQRKADLLEMLQSLLDPQTKLAPAIADRLAAQPGQIAFITGVGEVFPYIRSHNVLNNLQSVAKDRPLVMFFPGEYRQSATLGSSLELFGRLHDDQYYRAFNIFDYAV